ncbi:MAG TPA: hypothetical protein VEW42_01580 [Candidatus Eisenbacteria bacterium]|nr:hypothetical protein [Candidatus Eisenbacteria bacterium]
MVSNEVKQKAKNVLNAVGKVFIGPTGAPLVHPDAPQFPQLPVRPTTQRRTQR